METYEIINKYRVFPRLLLIAFVYLWYRSTMWFMGLESPTMPQGAFIGTVWGSLALFANFYFKTGGNTSE